LCRGFQLLRVCLRWRVVLLRDLNSVATLRGIDRRAQIRCARSQHRALLLGERVAVLPYGVAPLRPGRVGIGPITICCVVAGTGIVGHLRGELVEFLYRLRWRSRACPAAAFIHVPDGLLLLRGSGLLLRAGEARETKQRSQNHPADGPRSVRGRESRQFDLPRNGYQPTTQKVLVLSGIFGRLLDMQVC